MMRTTATLTNHGPSHTATLIPQLQTLKYAARWMRRVRMNENVCFDETNAFVLPKLHLAHRHRDFCATIQ